MKNIVRAKMILAVLAAATATWMLPVAAAQAQAAQAAASAAPASAPKASKASKSSKAAAAVAVASKPATGKATAAPKLVNINSAPARKLQGLPGISAETARRIVAGRPYGSKAQLVTRGALDEPTYQSIRHLVIARQP